MAPLILEGNSLGQRHRHYNRLLMETLTSNKRAALGKISYDDNDIDNFMKIDIASYNRDIDYILDVYKCKDLLYVTRAIKKTRWLITDDNYSHIINPQYLHKELYPHMMLKAKSKLLLHIRLHLRNEKRVVHFYNYFKQFNLRSALKWLQYCPLQFALNEVNNHADKITPSMLKRLCRRSFEFLEKFAASSKVPSYSREEHLEEVQFLIKHNANKYLKITDSCCHGSTPYLKNKYLEIIMKTCPQGLLKNFFQHINRIDYSILIKYMGKESIKHFLLKCSKNEELSKIVRCHDIIIYFLLKIDYIDRIEVLKAFYDTTSSIDCHGPDGLNLFFSAIQDNAPFNSLNVICWYQCMPFDITYREITKLIQKELKSAKRLSMIKTLLICANSDFKNISILLKYYHDTHINEAYKFKINFVNEFLSRVATHKFDSEMWTILDKLFCSMEVYINSKLKVTQCIEAIIIYRIIHDQIVPEIVESKFEFVTFKSYKYKLNAVESEKLFTYLHNSRLKIIEKVTFSNEKEFKENVQSLKNYMELLADWNKNIIKYPIVIDKIKDVIKIEAQHGWDIDLSSLYNLHKPWKRYFFDVSVIMNPSKIILLNALKHDQNIFNMFKNEVDLVRSDRTITLQPLLSKLKIYWSDTLAKEWINEYLRHLKEFEQQKTAIQGLSVLLSQSNFLEIAKQYIPEDSKIDWMKVDELEYNCQKNFASNIHRVRPLPAADVILLFAKGDYLQFALASLNATLSNISQIDQEEYISSNLTSFPVSLQKHGIRIALAQLDIEKLLPIFEKIWKSTANSSIQTTLFLTTHRLLCEQSRKSKVLKLWNLLNMFIQNLSGSENAIIYVKMSRLSQVPEIVQSEYCMKAYLYFKTLPENLAVKYTDAMINDNVANMVKILDRNFIEEVVFESVDNFQSKSCFVVNLFARYLLSVADKENEFDTYERLVKPLFFNKKYYSCDNFEQMMHYLCCELCKYVSRNKRVPVNLFKTLLNYAKEILSLPEEYIALKQWELINDFVKILKQYVLPTDKYSEKVDEILKIDVISDFGRVCSKHLQTDSQTLPFSAYAIEYAMSDVFSRLGFENKHQLQIYKQMLEDQSNVESYFLVQRMLPKNLWTIDENKIKDEIIEILCSHPSKEFQMICRHCYQKGVRHDS